MTPHKQLHRHRPADGQIGDCWRTCIACLLDMAPGEVPHFVDGCWQDSAKSMANARAWLAGQGLAIIEYALSADLSDVLRSVGAINPGMYYLLGGNSATGVGHSVVCCDDGIVWDPSLDDAGIVGPMDDGYYWVSWLVPALLLRAGGGCHG